MAICPDAVRSIDSQQVLGYLADLPVAVLETPVQCRVDIGAVEGGECDRRPSPNGRFVVEGGQDCRQSGIITDGPERGDGSFAAQRVIMSGIRGGHAGQREHRTTLLALTHGPGGHLHHRGIGVVEVVQQIDRSSRGRQFGGPPADGRSGVVQRSS